MLSTSSFRSCIVSTRSAAWPAMSNRFAALATLGESLSQPSTVASASKRKKRGGLFTVSKTMPANKAEGKSTTLHDPLVWIDLEMTGLELEKDTIIEIAVLVSDGKLQTVHEGPEIAIHHPDDVLDNMNEWCIEHHGKSGLTQRCKDSTISLAAAEQQVLEFIQQHVQPQAAQLAGNSIHVDRMFLSKYMPKLVQYLHYRIVDVSTVKELCRRWYPDVYKRAPRKALSHTAMSDIRESLEELKYYKKHLFK